MNRAFLLIAALPLLAAAAPARDWKHQALVSAAPFIDRDNEEWMRAIVTGDADVLSEVLRADLAQGEHDVQAYDDSHAGSSDDRPAVVLTGCLPLLPD